MREYIEKHCDEICEKCGYIEKENEHTLETNGAPISGLYYVCPKCGKDWTYKEINIKNIEMVEMTKEEYLKLIGF